MEKNIFYDLEYEELKAYLSNSFNLDEKKSSMRANQIWKFVYKKGLMQVDSFLNISNELKENLENKINFDRITISEEKKSVDGTIKWLLKLKDNNLVETVYIPFGKTGTLCISSQVGCTLNCKFCHTGTQMMVRNLDTSEIVQQLLIAKDRLTDWGSKKKFVILFIWEWGNHFIIIQM